MRTVHLKDEGGGVLGQIETMRSGRYVGLNVNAKGGGGVGVAMDEQELTELIQVLTAELAELKARNA